MCCRDCCTCECGGDKDGDNLSESLQEFLDTNKHPDSIRLMEFLKFFKRYHDANVLDREWYTEQRLLDLFEALPVNL